VPVDLEGEGDAEQAPAPDAATDAATDAAPIQEDVRSVPTRPEAAAASAPAASAQLQPQPAPASAATDTVPRPRLVPTTKLPAAPAPGLAPADTLLEAVRRFLRLPRDRNCTGK